MIITFVAIKNFRSFLLQHGVGLRKPPGVYFMTGVNEVEPELEANGTGKSSFWEALCWALYGKTSRNLRASDIGTWSVGKGTEVEVGIEFDDEPGTTQILKRCWNPNSLTLSGQDITQVELESKLGLSHAAFLHSVFISQFNPTFLDLSASDKAALLSEVLELDRWLEYSERASGVSKEVQKAALRVESELVSAEGALGELQRSASSGNDDAAAWELERRKKLEELEHLLSEYDAHIAKIEHQLAEVEAEATTVSALAQRSRDGVQQYDAELADVAVTLQELEGSRRELKVKLDHARKQRDLLSAGTCSVCKQGIPHEHQVKETRRLGIVGLSSDLDEVQALYEAAEKKRADTIAQRKAVLDVQVGVLAAEAAAKDRVNLRKQQLSASLSQRESRQRERDQLVREVNPHRQKLGQLEERQLDLNATVLLRQDELAELSAKLARTSYWVKGFKDLRLFLISEALMQLEVEVNNALMQLGLVDWSIQFSIDAETKSGTTKRGFTVMVKAPHSSGPVPWEAWSGGESQRLRLAAQLGLSSLISSYTGTTSNLEVWDEPSTWMSAKGISDLLETLEARAQRIGRAVWVVDHRALEYGGFASILTVRKDAEGSHVEDPAQRTEEKRRGPIRRRRLVG